MAVIQKESAEQGFTLIETLVVMMMIGIMAAIATPSVLAFIAKAKVNSALSNLNGLLQITQQEAIKRSKDCALLLPINDSDSGVISSDCLITGSETLTEVKIKYNNAASKKVSFNYRGETSPLRTIVIYSDITRFKKCLVISNGIGMTRRGIYTKDDLTTISADFCDTTT